MVARSSVVALTLLIGGAANVVMAQASSSAQPRAIGERIPFSHSQATFQFSLGVRVLAIGEKNATALRGRERMSPVLLELEFDAGSRYEGLILTPRTAFVLRVGEQRFPVDYIAFHSLDQPSNPPQVNSVTDDLRFAGVFTGKAMLGLLFDLPPAAAHSTGRLLEMRSSEGAQPILVSVDREDRRPARQLPRSRTPQAPRRRPVADR